MPSLFGQDIQQVMEKGRISLYRPTHQCPLLAINIDDIALISRSPRTGYNTQHKYAYNQPFHNVKVLLIYLLQNYSEKTKNGQHLMVILHYSKY